jgi:hypothetical protein
MTRPVHLPHDIWSEAFQSAIHEGFPEVIRILRGFRDGGADLEEGEAAHLLEFARFLRLKALLHFPYWDDSEPRHSQEHEDCFHEVNMGLHEKLFAYIEASQQSAAR